MRFSSARHSGVSRKPTVLLWAFAGLLAALLAGSDGAEAARISVLGRNAAGVALVSLSGQITTGDEARLRAATADMSPVILLLSSKGGLGPEAIRLGDLVRARGFTTAVAASETCASACAMVWLASEGRLIETEARVGFHAAANMGGTAVSRQGNAAMRAYYEGLGFNRTTVVALMSASPKQMMWLTPRKAQELHIRVEKPARQTLAVASTGVVHRFAPYPALMRATGPVCELNTTLRVISLGEQGKETLRQHINRNMDTLLKECWVVEERRTLVVEKAHPKAPILCIRPDGQTRCRWTRLNKIRAL